MDEIGSVGLEKIEEGNNMKRVFDNGLEDLQHLKIRHKQWLKTQEKIVRLNFDSLFKTAMDEIKKRDAVIKQLRQKIFKNEDHAKGNNGNENEDPVKQSNLEAIEIEENSNNTKEKNAKNLSNINQILNPKGNSQKELQISKEVESKTDNSLEDGELDDSINPIIEQSNLEENVSMAEEGIDLLTSDSNQNNDKNMVLVPINSNSLNPSLPKQNSLEANLNLDSEVLLKQSDDLHKSTENDNKMIAFKEEDETSIIIECSSEEEESNPKVPAITTKPVVVKKTGSSKPKPLKAQNNNKNQNNSVKPPTKTNNNYQRNFNGRFQSKIRGQIPQRRINQPYMRPPHPPMFGPPPPPMFGPPHPPTFDPPHPPMFGPPHPPTFDPPHPPMFGLPQFNQPIDEYRDQGRSLTINNFYLNY